ncbi:uncharacterized protein LOC126757256 [Bactrocera neohumeralis]|uniref:uncharacterized protein LOC120772863 n=1 Tax=Bactrocera tryoni TaxID=59916 RepID=UPI001A97345A|nr:uncharacterized protein LOC120772863 [Bactrocera tryoni]XP_050326981.1 uncharacterized protein LOC126757256 [Bactrocera neohumeralis]
MDDNKMMENFQLKAKPQDNASPRATEEVDLEEKHKQLRGFAEKLRAEYYEAYRQMTAELRPSQLDGFAEVLMEHQKHVVQNQDELICEMREQLMQSLKNSLDRFWEEYDVTDRVAELEMLKEQCNKFKGSSWNVRLMKPVERTLPLRMRFKETRLRYLEKQLSYQNEQLKSLMAVNCRERSRIRNMEQQRKSMLVTLVRYSQDIEKRKSLAKQITADLIFNTD